VTTNYSKLFYFLLVHRIFTTGKDRGFKFGRQPVNDKLPGKGRDPFKIDYSNSDGNMFKIT